MLFYRDKGRPFAWNHVSRRYRNTQQLTRPLYQLGSEMLLDSDYDEKHLTPTEDDNVAIISPDNDADSMVDDPEPPSEPAPPRADDHEAIRDRYLPVMPDYETEAEAIFTWDIENWRSLPKRSHSPVFECAGHPWRILFFPAGNSASESTSFYLEQGFDNEKPPENWYACAQFMLVLQNPSDPSIYIHHEASHRFTAEEGDWGFTRFADKNRIFAAKFDNLIARWSRTTALRSRHMCEC